MDKNLMNLMKINNPLLLQNQSNYFNNNEMTMNNPILNQMVYPMNSPMLNLNNQMNNQMNNPILNQMKTQINNPMMNQINRQMKNPIMNQMNNQVKNQMNILMMNQMLNKMNNPMLSQMNYPIKNMNNINNPMMNQMDNTMMNMKNNMMNTNNLMNNTMVNQMNNLMMNMNIMMNQMNNPINNINCPIMFQNNNNIFNQECIMNSNKIEEEANYNLSADQMRLIKLIFKFYEDHKDTNKNIFMNFKHPKQVKSLINHLFPNYSELKQIYDDDNDKNNIFGELLPYIHEEKKIIKFINSNKMLYNIKIPCSIKKSDLYGIAELYKGLTLSNIILIHNNNILNNDESSIEDISNGDSIIIIEDRIYPDNSYYLSIQKKYKNNNRNQINVVFKEFRRLLGTHNFVLSEMVTLTEMINSINLFFGLDYRNLRLMYNMRTIESNETTISNYFTGYLVNVTGIKKQNERNLTECRIIGKNISAKLLNDKNKEEFKVVVGRLNNTKVLFCPDLDHGFGLFKDNLRGLYNIYINNKEIKYEDNQSFSSLGIDQDFVCRVKLKK